MSKDTNNKKTQEQAIKAPSLRTFVVDESSVVRAGLCALIERAEDLAIAGECADLSDIQRAVKDTRPQLLLLGSISDKSNLIEAIKEIKQQFPDLKVVLWMEAAEDSEILDWLACGADGYSVRQSNFEPLQQAMRAVARGDFWLDSSISRRLVSDYLSQQRSRRQRVSDDELLTVRELEVLKLVAKGLSNEKIGQELKISAETVKSHIRHIMRKMLVNDRTQAAVKALKEGLI